ncbi:MAG: RdgB/HAM1 family non-canonical purine NTP pyrophosphatase [Bacteroidota bacterium]
MKKILVFATNNKYKATEIQQLVGDGFEIKTLEDIACREDIVESGLSLTENATIKSKYVFNTYGLDCFADDTGLEVEALNGAPGVYSARYAGSQKSDGDNIGLLLANMEQQSNRKARFRTVISCMLNGEENLFEGILEGEIIREPIGTNGFGYDPVFKPLHSHKTLAELNTAEKNEISHRAKATRKLIQFLREQS